MMLFKVGTAAAASAMRGPVRPDVALRRQNLDVLLLDAEHRQSLAALRAYSRAGLRVGAAACESESWWAPSLNSRFCRLAATVPDLGEDADAFTSAVLDLLDRYPTRMVLPAYDGTIEALRHRRAEIERRTALPLASERALDIAVNKTRTLAVAGLAGLRVPRSIHINNLGDLAPALREVGFPAVVKPHESWVERDGKGVRLSPNVVQTLDEAKAVYAHVISEGGRALIQQFLPGRREAVTMFYANDEVWARLAQISYREWPVLGGASVLCETIPLLPDITSDAERLVRAIDLEGCSMVEFRRDRDGHPVLMEVNPRVGGSVALAIAAGVNFPQLMYDWKVNSRLTRVDSYRVGNRLHWLAGDIWNLKCAFEMQGHPDIPSRKTALAKFVCDFARPGNTLDGVEISDMRPALSELYKMLVQHGTRRVMKLMTRNQPLMSKG